MENNELFKRNIVFLMSEKGWNKKFISDKLGYVYNTFASYFKEGRYFPRKVQVELAKFFGVDLHILRTMDYAANQAHIIASSSLVNEDEVFPYGGKRNMVRYSDLLALYRKSQQRVLDLENDVEKHLSTIEMLTEKIKRMTDDMLNLQSKLILLMERFNNDVPS